VNPADWDTLIEDALKRRPAMQAPADFTRRVKRRAAEDRAENDPRLRLVYALNTAATVLIAVGLLLLSSPQRLGDWLDALVDLVQRGGTAIGAVTGMNPPAPLVLAALAVWVAGRLVSDWMELVD
jgi:hypothetical protein